MPHRLPPLNPLRAFEATARQGSLTRAAAELNVTHGAVSHQIRALEAALNVKLFDRVGQRLKLTAHGADLLPAVAQAFEGIATATARLSRSTTAGTLSVLCVPALLSFWLMPRLGSFLAQYPDVRLRLDASRASAPPLAPEVDVAILYGDGNWPDHWVRLWATFDLFPVVSPTLMNTRPLRTVRDIASHLILHADEGREWHSWLSRADALDLFRGPQHHLCDARLALEAAVQGHGVALGDSITAANLLARGQLVTPFTLGVPAPDAYYVVCRRDARSASNVQVFIDWLYATLAEASARGEGLVAAPQTNRRSAPRRDRVSRPVRRALNPG